MSDTPWYPWYVGDARAKMRRLTLAQKGACRELFDEIYATREPLPNDIEQLCLIAGALTLEDRAAVQSVIDRFFPIGADGMRHSKRADKELALQKQRIDSYSNRGKKGARSRWQYPPLASPPTTTPTSTTTTTSSQPLAEPLPQPMAKALALPMQERKVKNITRSASACDRPKNVSEQVWSDFQAIRRAKKSPLTATALRGIEREAGKAGVTLQAALETACERGWQGFKADWIGAARGSGKTAGNREALDEFADKIRAEHALCNPQEKDITP